MLVTLLMKSRKANTIQLSTKSKATTTPMSLRSSQLSIQNTSKTSNETNYNGELVSIIRTVVKKELEDHEKKCCESRIWKQLIKD